MNVEAWSTPCSDSTVAPREGARAPPSELERLLNIYECTDMHIHLYMTVNIFFGCNTGIGYSGESRAFRVSVLWFVLRLG